MARENNRTDETGLLRLKVAIRGAVQGVGFRPFVFRLAEELGLKGWVNNSAEGVFIEVEGPRGALESFLFRVQSEKPPRSFIQSLESSWLDPVGFADFQIRQSEASGAKTTLVLPDIATCPDCLREIFDPHDRRYFYPFTNCTNCGPRFSIIEKLPYDRANTSMKKFTMCPQCQAEYDDPRDRRFHAQPNACPICGPQVELWDGSGQPVAGGPPTPDLNALSAAPLSEPLSRTSSDLAVSSTKFPTKFPTKARKRDFSQNLQLSGASAGGTLGVLQRAAEVIRAGQVLALKGLGGFHLVIDARNDEGVRRLRERKHREEKPLALMFPSLESVQAVCEVSLLEEHLLRSPEAPIVLLRRRSRGGSETAPAIAPSVAPHNPYLGVMLPYTPLHHLLLSLLGFPIVATSGNLSDEPISIDEREALERLHDIADAFLVHNRPIVRHVDDSIVRVMAGREMVLRRARGFAPLPVQLLAAAEPVEPRASERAATEPAGREAGAPGSGSVLAVGGHLKNSVALSVGPQVFISQHIGDLETEPAYEAFRRVIRDFENLYEAEPGLVAADAHPDYLSTKYAREATGPLAPGQHSPRLVSVQHHLAHVLSCMAENELEPPLLGVSWDGTGYGLDGTIWGGEFFQVTASGAIRIGHLRTFRLPGGDKAVKEPRRTALGVLFELFGKEAFGMGDLPSVSAFSSSELNSVKAMLERQLNSPVTSSAGRLFDAVASLAGLHQQVRFEGQAAMELEFALEDVNCAEAYPVALERARARAQRLPSAISSQESSSVARSGFAAPEKGRAPLILDWAPLVREVIADVRKRTAPGIISARFHNALVHAIVEAARSAAESRVVLTGGCFQNRYLTENSIKRLEEAGFRPYWHQRVPPNDGGLVLGQVVAARRQTSLR